MDISWVFWGLYFATVLIALVVRNRVYAIFLAVLLGVQTWIWTVLAHAGGVWTYLVLGMSVLVHVHFLSLTRPQLRPIAWRIAVTWPAWYFVAATLLSLPWAVGWALGFEVPGVVLAFGIAGLGLVQSMTHTPSVVGLPLADTRGFRRVKPCDPSTIQGLRIGHLTDFHLGPFVSAKRARAAVERIVAADPDIVLLTGDFMTMESQNDRAALTFALEPFAAMTGRVFACRGNHDLEAPETVSTVCEALGIRLLIDEAVDVETPLGRVQIAGIDFRFRKVSEHIHNFVASLKPSDVPRIIMLHDPGHFRYLPDDAADLVLSGHTHGGQLGFLSLGIPLTIVGLSGVVPDQGLFARGRMRLYVNRGLGHYGFPLRIGVPAEESILHVALNV